jgi:hypothetical protein
MAITPRRYGKSVSMAMFTLALLLCVPGIRICIFSTGKRASGGLMEIIMKLLNETGNSKQRIVKRNQEQLYVCAHDKVSPDGVLLEPKVTLHDDPNTSKLYSYPASVSGNTTYIFFHFLFHNSNHQYGYQFGNRAMD